MQNIEGVIIEIRGEVEYNRWTHNNLKVVPLRWVFRFCLHCFCFAGWHTKRKTVKFVEKKTTQFRSSCPNPGPQEVLKSKLFQDGVINNKPRSLQVEVDLQHGHYWK